MSVLRSALLAMLYDGQKVRDPYIDLVKSLIDTEFEIARTYAFYDGTIRREGIVYILGTQEVYWMDATSDWPRMLRRWLEEAGWRGFSIEERAGAAELLQKNRPASFVPISESGRKEQSKVDLISARRTASIHRVLESIQGGLRPRWVILQARDPQPDVFSAMNRAGYRLDHFIHDDEYYRWKGEG